MLLSSLLFVYPLLLKPIYSKMYIFKVPNTNPNLVLWTNFLSRLPHFNFSAGLFKLLVITLLNVSLKRPFYLRALIMFTDKTYTLIKDQLRVFSLSICKFFLGCCYIIRKQHPQQRWHATYFTRWFHNQVNLNFVYIVGCRGILQLILVFQTHWLGGIFG